MKLPAFFPPALRKKKKLRASAGAHRPAMGPAELDDLGEPNMKLSRALLIVLVLHVVAVAGIIAFNAIKSRQETFTRTAAAAASATASPSLKASTAEEPVATPIPAKKGASSPTLSRGEKKPRTELLDGGKTYVVARGDSPVTIAKKFKISADDLLAANKIDDPHKLKIGQKLVIPAGKKKKS